MGTYTKTNYVDGAAPARNAANLNNTENGIKNAHDELNVHEQDIIDLSAKINNNTTSINNNKQDIDKNTNDISVLSSGENMKGAWTPTAETEYPTAVVNDSYYIGSVSENGYTYVTGDLVGETVHNMDKIIKTGSGWSLISNNLLVSIPNGAIGTINTPIFKMLSVAVFNILNGTDYHSFTNNYTLDTAYNSGTTYATGDIASSSGYNWVSKVDGNLNNTPVIGGNFWQISAPSYVDIYGVLRYAGVDQKRHEKKGQVQEGISSNYAILSNVFSTSGAGLIDGTTTAPDEDDIAQTVKVDVGGVVSGANPSTGVRAQKITGHLLTNTKYTATQSIFMKKITSSIGTRVFFIFKNSIGTIVARADFNISFDDFGNLVIDSVIADSGTINDYGVIETRDGGRLWCSMTSPELLNEALFYGHAGKSEGDESMYWGWQAEELGTVSSFNSTIDTVVTRGAEVLAFGATDYYNYTFSTQTIHLNFSLNGINHNYGNQRMFHIQHSTATRYRIDFTTDNKLAFAYGITPNYTARDFIGANHNDISITFGIDLENNEMFLSQFGNAPAVDAVNMAAILYQNSGAAMRIGSDNDGSLPMYGHIKEVSTYDNRLKDAVIALL